MARLVTTSGKTPDHSTLTFYPSDVAFFSGSAAFDKALLDAAVKRRDTIFGDNYSGHYTGRVLVHYHLVYGEQLTIHQFFPSVLQLDSRLASPL